MESQLIHLIICRDVFILWNYYYITMDKSIEQLEAEEKQVFNEISELIKNCKEGEQAVQILVLSGMPEKWRGIAFDSHVEEAKRRLSQ